MTSVWQATASWQPKGANNSNVYIRTFWVHSSYAIFHFHQDKFSRLTLRYLRHAINACGVSYMLIISRLTCIMCWLTQGAAYNVIRPLLQFCHEDVIGTLRSAALFSVRADVCAMLMRRAREMRFVTLRTGASKQRVIFICFCVIPSVLIEWSSKSADAHNIRRIFIFNKERADNRKDSAAAAANRRLVIKPFTSRCWCGADALCARREIERERGEWINCALLGVLLFIEMRWEACVRPIVLISHACAREINANQAVRPAQHFIYTHQ